MMTERTVITTTESPCPLATKKIVRWEVSSLDTLLRREIETEVDFGLPRSKLHMFAQHKSEPQEMRLRRDNPIMGNYQDGFEIRLSLNNAMTVRVRWSLRLSPYGGEPGVETTLVNERVCTVEPCTSSTEPRKKFRLSELGPVGTAIATTGRIRIEAEATLVAERTDSRRTLRSPGPCLANAIGAALTDEELLEMSDATLVSTDGTEHPAHRLLLSTRSPVFRAAFRRGGAGGMREARTGRIDVDASDKAVEQLLKFVYTDDIDDFSEDEDLLLEVFGLGSFYELPRLLGLAEVQMLETLSVQNVARRLLLATKHNSSFRYTCIEMVKENIAEVMKSEGWKDIANDACVISSLIADNKGKSYRSKDRKNPRKRSRR